MSAADPCVVAEARVAVHRDNWRPLASRLAGELDVTVIALIPFVAGAELVYLEERCTLDEAWEHFGAELPPVLAGVIIQAPVSICDSHRLAELSEAMP